MKGYIWVIYHLASHTSVTGVVGSSMTVGIYPSCQEATTQWMKEADILGSWLEDGGLKTAVPRHEAKLFNEVYIHFRKDMDEMGIKYIPGLLKFNSKVRGFIANDPRWEEVRHADGKKIQRSNLVTRLTGNL